MYILLMEYIFYLCTRPCTVGSSFGGIRGGMDHTEGSPTSIVDASCGVLSEGYGHDGLGVCQGDGQTEAYTKNMGMTGPECAPHQLYPNMVYIKLHWKNSGQDEELPFKLMILYLDHYYPKLTPKHFM